MKCILDKVQYYFFAKLLEPRLITFECTSHGAVKVYVFLYGFRKLDQFRCLNSPFPYLYAWFVFLWPSDMSFLVFIILCFFKEKCSLFMTVLPPGYWCVSAVLISLQWSCVFGSLEYRSFLILKASQASKVFKVCWWWPGNREVLLRFCHCQSKSPVKCLSLLASSQSYIICSHKKHASFFECYINNIYPSQLMEMPTILEKGKAVKTCSNSWSLKMMLC